MRNSSERLSATIMAIVSRLRVWRGKPGRVQISPQAFRVMKSWNSRLNSVVEATARSTYSSPRTARRTFIPCSRRFASSMIHPLTQEELRKRLVEGVGLFDVRKVRGIQLFPFGSRNLADQ